MMEDVLRAHTLTNVPIQEKKRKKNLAESFALKCGLNNDASEVVKVLVGLDQPFAKNSLGCTYLLIKVWNAWPANAYFSDTAGKCLPLSSRHLRKMLLCETQLCSSVLPLSNGNCSKSSSLRPCVCACAHVQHWLLKSIDFPMTKQSGPIESAPS